MVRNNIAANYYVGGTNVVADHNIDIADYDPDALFMDYRNYDLRHRVGSPAIDSGSNIYAPDRDINGISRPQGAGYDIGAYEYTTSDGFLYGDVSDDSEITAYDASLAAHIAVGLNHPGIENRDAAEVSGDDEVTAYDAALIAQYAVGLIDRFPAEER